MPNYEPRRLHIVPTAGTDYIRATYGNIAQTESPFDDWPFEDGYVLEMRIELEATPGDALVWQCADFTNDTGIEVYLAKSGTDYYPAIRHRGVGTFTGSDPVPVGDKCHIIWHYTASTTTALIAVDGEESSGTLGAPLSLGIGTRLYHLFSRDTSIEWASDPEPLFGHIDYIRLWEVGSYWSSIPILRAHHHQIWPSVFVYTGDQGVYTDLFPSAQWWADPRSESLCEYIDWVAAGDRWELAGLPMWTPQDFRPLRAPRDYEALDPTEWGSLSDCYLAGPRAGFEFAADDEPRLRLWGQTPGGFQAGTCRLHNSTLPGSAATVHPDFDSTVPIDQSGLDSVPTPLTVSFAGDTSWWRVFTAVFRPMEYGPLGWASVGDAYFPDELVTFKINDEPYITLSWEDLGFITLNEFGHPTAGPEDFAYITFPALEGESDYVISAFDATHELSLACMEVIQTLVFPGAFNIALLGGDYMIGTKNDPNGLVVPWTAFDAIDPLSRAYSTGVYINANATYVQLDFYDKNATGSYTKTTAQSTNRALAADEADGAFYVQLTQAETNHDEVVVRTQLSGCVSADVTVVLTDESDVDLSEVTNILNRWDVDGVPVGWVDGAQLVTFEVTDTDTGQPIPNVHIWVTSDFQGATLIGSSHSLTGTNGRTTVGCVVSPEDSTVYAWAQCPGYAFDIPVDYTANTSGVVAVGGVRIEGMSLGQVTLEELRTMLRERLGDFDRGMFPDDDELDRYINTAITQFQLETGCYTATATEVATEIGVADYDITPLYEVESVSLDGRMLQMLGRGDPSLIDDSFANATEVTHWVKISPTQIRLYITPDAVGVLSIVGQAVSDAITVSSGTVTGIPAGWEYAALDLAEERARGSRGTNPVQIEFATRARSRYDQSVGRLRQIMSEERK